MMGGAPGMNRIANPNKRGKTNAEIDHCFVERQRRVAPVIRCRLRAHGHDVYDERAR